MSDSLSDPLESAPLPGMLIEASGIESLIVMPFVLLFGVLFKINIVISLAGSSSLPVVDVAYDTIDGSNPR